MFCLRSTAGYLDKMLLMMRKLGQSGGRMRHDTYESVVRAMCRAKLSERARRVMAWMRSSGHRPTQGTAAALVVACCADGQ
eukprot:4364140-Pyramimonas_sp.AAC.1